MLRKWSRILVWASTLVATLWLWSPAQGVWACGGTVICVDIDATSETPDGSSWETAYTNLQDALAVPHADSTTDYEIWIAEGIYYPDEGGGAPPDDPAASFRIATNNVKLYGGFAGDETARGQRDWEAHLTILSGDLQQDDTVDARGVVTATAGIIGTNAYNILYLDGFAHESITGDTVIDGVTITAGKTYYSGGGLYCDGKGSGQCSPSLTNVTFSGNQAGYGGGMFNDGEEGTSNPSLTNVTFSGNQATNGAGMYNEGKEGTSSPTLTDVTFSGNQATGNGGGMYNYAVGEYNKSGNSSPSLTDVTFSGNQAGNNGGGIYNHADAGEADEGTSSPSLTDITFSGNQAGNNGGGMYNHGSLNGTSSPILTSVLFSGNQASEGGGMYNDGDKGTSSPSLTNVIFSGNQAGNGGGMYNYGSNLGISSPSLTHVTFSGNRADYGGGMFNDVFTFGSSHPTLTNVILWGNTADNNGNQVYSFDVTLDLSYTLIQSGDNDIVSPVTYGAGIVTADPHFIAPVSATAAPTTAGDYHLQVGSPAIDAGDPATCPTTDLDGLPRPNDGDGNGTATCDIGAYEAGTMVCGVAADTAYTFPNHEGVMIAMTSLGNTDCLYVDEVGIDHAGAAEAEGTGTGRYWRIEALQSSKTMTATGFTAVLTLPHTLSTPADASVCRYSEESWDCGRDGYDTTTVWRSGITAFSDWSVGQTGDAPSITTIASFTARNRVARLVVPLLLALGVGEVRYRRRDRATGGQGVRTAKS